MWIGLTSADMPILEMLGYGWQSIYLTMATYTKLCGILPYLIYLLSMTIHETSNWMPRRRYMYRQPCRTEYNSDHYSRDQIKCRTAEITSRIQWLLQYGIQCHICFEVTSPTILPNEIPTQTRRFRATQLRWQLTTAIDFRIKPFQSMFPTKLYGISRRQSNDFQRGGWPYQKLKQPLPQTITVPEMQERHTVRSIHQLGMLAAASVPGHESTSGLRERQ
jgi:hypothetical protein